MRAAIYTHPEDKGVSFDPTNNTITAWDEDNSVTMPIGRLGLAEAGHILLALAEKQSANNEEEQ